MIKNLRTFVPVMEPSMKGTLFAGLVCNQVPEASGVGIKVEPGACVFGMARHVA
jgi:hypothetical protein